MERWRLAGLPLVAAILLIAGAVKLWSAGAAPAIGGAFFGAGLLTLGIAVRDWIEHHTHDQEDRDDRTP